MKTLLTFLVLLLTLTAQAAYTEFYTHANGANVNSGHTTNNAAVFSKTGGAWDQATGVYSFTDDDTVFALVPLGSWASIYEDGFNLPRYIGRVTATNLTSITVSLAAGSGSPPTNSESGMSLKVGGAWLGPSHSAGASVVGHPFTFVNNQMTNTSGDWPRFFIKNDQVYAVTNLSIASNGPMRFEGYATTPGDGGQTIISGVSPGASSAMFTISVPNIDFAYFNFRSNGVSGTASGVSITGGGSECTFYRCGVYYMRGGGFVVGGQSLLLECEAATNCLGASTIFAGITLSTVGATARRCISHDNATIGGAGFVLSSLTIAQHCVAHRNARDGFYISSTTVGLITDCDSYNNTSNGVAITSATAQSVLIENVNVFKNGGRGIQSINNLRSGIIKNVVFGTGTATNGLGSINTALLGMIDVAGSIDYGANLTPWVAPDSGNFSLTNTATTLYLGRGSFFQNAADHSGTVSYPDIGACAATNAAGGTTTTISYPMFRR